ncbi:MAG TPA: hypothetical protein VFU12_00385 [Glycomyces sp.]|nr:hypothetical protein [Glycomyces sp.]
MTEASSLESRKPDSLERGTFSDGARIFNVRASSEHAPDSFHVYADEHQRELVLVVTGLNSQNLKAAWGAEWRTASTGWREWFEAKAFMVFHNGDRPGTGEARVCNG